MDKQSDLVDLLNEVKPGSVGKKEGRINITIDEIEEKDVAIQMLTVFIDELGAGFADYVEPTSKILLSMIQYEANDSIRNSVATALPGLIKCVKESNQNSFETLAQIGRAYMESLFKAIKNETETETLTCQVQAMKDIIDEVGVSNDGSTFMQQDVLQHFLSQILDLYT